MVKRWKCNFASCNAAVVVKGKQKAFPSFNDRPPSRLCGIASIGVCTCDAKRRCNNVEKGAPQQPKNSGVYTVVLPTRHLPVE